jgi:hypothetical protein
VLDDLHRTYDIEPLRFLHEDLSRSMPERQRRCQTRVRGCVARRDADVFRRGVDGERVGAETCETLLKYVVEGQTKSVDGRINKMKHEKMKRRTYLG